MRRQFALCAAVVAAVAGLIGEVDAADSPPVAGDVAPIPVTPVGPRESAWNGLDGSADPVFAADDSITLRLSELEAAFAASQAEHREKAEQARRKPTFKMNGRIHLDYWNFPNTTPGIGFFEHPNPSSPQFGQDPEDLFLFRRIRMELSGDLLEDMFWRIQIDFNEPATPQMKDVYVGFRDVLFGQELVIGNQKRPLGLDALNSSRYNVFMERPEINEAFNEDARRLGILLSGSNEDASFNWAYGVYNLENIQEPGKYRGDAYQLSGNLRLHGSPWYEADGANWLHWAIAGMIANPDGNRSPTATNNNEARFRTRPEGRTLTRWLDTGPIAGADFYELLGVEAIYNRGPFQLCGEYMTTWLQRDNVTPGTGPDLFFHGGYLYASYFLTGEHMTYQRDVGQLDRVFPIRNFDFGSCCWDEGKRGWGAWQVAVRYSFLDLSSHDITGGFERAWTFAVNWHWTAYAKLQFDVSYGKIDERGPIGGFDSGYYLLTGTRIAIDF